MRTENVRNYTGFIASCRSCLFFIVRERKRERWGEGGRECEKEGKTEREGIRRGIETVRPMEHFYLRILFGCG